MRIAAELPVTATSKLPQRRLRAERWDGGEPFWWRPQRDGPLRRMTPDDAAAIRRAFAANGRTNELEER